MTGCDLLDFGSPTRQNNKRLPCERLMAENENLREFVAGMWRLLVEHCDMDESHLAEVDAVRDGLSELGIEVD